MSAPDFNREPDRRPWHEGEIRARALAGAPDMPPAIRRCMTEQMRAFFPRLPMIFTAGIDVSGRPVASLLRGAPGFVACPEPQRLEIAAQAAAGDGLDLRPGAPFGLIGMDFLARRRNRVNGRIVEARDGRLALHVQEAFGNGPKYILPRLLYAAAGAPGTWRDVPSLDAVQQMISGADVFFIATRGPDGVDVSHRGGAAGFVQMAPDGALVAPDFPGNRYFNTFGNLQHDKRASLLFVDFPAGRVVRLAGAARVDFDFARSWRFTPAAAWLLDAGAPLGGAAEV